MTVLLFLIMLLILNKSLYCNGMAINPLNSGGLSIQEDPAPGRSPGPPEITSPHHRATDEQPTVLLTSERAEIINSDCTPFGNVKIDAAREAVLNLTVSHELFRTDLLVPGIKYQVSIKHLRDSLPIDFTISSTSTEGIFIGTFLGKGKPLHQCEPHVVKSQLNSDELTTFTWTTENDDNLFNSNVTFELNYMVEGNPTVYYVAYKKSFTKECQLFLFNEEATISWNDFLLHNDCQVWFPTHGTGHGLVVELTRLNVPCSKGHLHFSGLNITQHQHFRSHKQAHLCGKLEEIPETDRHIYFPSSHTPPVLHLHGGPIFALSYHLVDYCYNVTFVTRNGSFELKPSGELQCTFKIYLPYGNRVALTLHIGDSTSTGLPEIDNSIKIVSKIDNKCEGLLTQLLDGDNTWSHCTRHGEAERRIEIVSRGNKVVLKVSVRSSEGVLGMRMYYRAEPIEEIVGICGFGWVALRQFCVSAVEGSRLPWAQAEMDCVRRGGHIASIRSEYAQNIIDNLLLNSPGYRNYNAYWIGASDKTHEGDFRWSDNLPFSYTNWFPGWSQHGHYNKQPNDDGLSEQDCVEVRRIYALPSSSANLASSFMWNDRDCSTPNYFICERLQSDEPLEDSWPLDCNRTVILSRQQPRVAVSSPGFPRQYPDNAVCKTDITAPPGYRLVLDFEELVLENEPSCSYDYLEILENFRNNSTLNNTSSGRRLCGDWSSKLKLLRYVSNGSRLRLRFSSDYSHHFGGFKARISMENVLQCSDDRLQMFNNSCYLFVSYPEVTWNTSRQICKGIKAELASILTPDEERFITTNIRKTSEYRTSELYWLGARAENNHDFRWVDGNEMAYFGWPPGQKPEKGDGCLGIQWIPSPAPIIPSGLYWKSHKCTTVGGYVCKRQNQNTGSITNFNKTINGTQGNLTTPNYPGNYYNNMDFSIRIIGPERTRLIVQFIKIDIETQLECLYDYVKLESIPKNRQKSKSAKWCGSHDTDMQRFSFVSISNEIEIKFHSDYSLSGSGFYLKWKAVDVSGCPTQTLTAKEGTLTSPNYPDFLLPNLICTITILAPTGKRIWLEFENYDFGKTLISENSQMIIKSNEETVFELILGKESPVFQPFETYNLLTEGTFVSSGEQLQLKLRTKDKPVGFGFKATYKILQVVKEERIIKLTNSTFGSLLNLNYPDNPPANVDLTQHFVAPIGHIISLELYHVKLRDTECTDVNGVLEVSDNYADSNGTKWNLCYSPDEGIDDALNSLATVAISSFLNTIHLRQKNGPLGILLNGTIKVHLDSNYKIKLLKYQKDVVESCSPNPCHNGGKCVSNGVQKFCQCSGHFTGLFCALTQCDLEPCVFGSCELTHNSYKCHCRTGYMGQMCEQKRKPCERNPCEGRGICSEDGSTFKCQCHAWWEGPRCERRMKHIPYKPLSERMLREPFWLGLMTVSVVMGVIGLVWCAKRHFPEKIEKLLAEDADRNRSHISSLRSTSVREQLAASGAAAVTVTPSPGPGVQRSLFGRLGIRKPSILSLTSPHASGYVPATARTFSLDDLLKPPPRRTPSPKKKRNNSTPTKKNAAEKKQILQQLISPAGNKQNSRKVSLGELLQLSERNVKDSNQKRENSEMRETKFSDNNTSQPVQLTLTDPKLEKKVTFARLLNKVSAEMSSGSDMELGIMQTNRLGCVFARPSSSPPSPVVDTRSPNSTSSNQGSDSLTSSDLAIPTALSSSISDLLSNRRPGKLPNGKPKPSSADSILAMFRNFSSSSAGANLSSSLKVSPSTTPTASSPQDDIAGDDESSTSSIHTPVSFSSGPSESPILHRQNQSTIEVPVLDPLSAHKSSNSGSNFLHPPTILLEIPSTINKCLSPIRELPTPLPSPMPSPALTPIMRRSLASSSAEEMDMSDDRISVELPNISISCSEIDEDDMHSAQDIAIDPQAEDGLILEEARSMQTTGFRNKSRPPTLGDIGKISNSSQESTELTLSQQLPLIIPTLTIQTPSPTHHRYTSPLFPGSPPPHRPATQQESSFQFPSKQNRKMLKEFDKPTSLDLPCAPPLITITCNMSEAESDAESSPAIKNATHPSASSAGMTYLSPFSIGPRGEHAASESNLSSSGYSSMASPGPSRCGSSNPLCPSETEEPGPPGPGSRNLHPQLGRRSSPLLKNSSNTSDCNNIERSGDQQRGRSDSETLSDDPLIESNDEGIGTDHIDEKIEEGELKSAKELEVFIVKECDKPKTLLDLTLLLPSTNLRAVAKCSSIEDIEHLMPPPSTNSKNSLQLPSIVVQCETNNLDKHLSPMSSRSESPLSDKTSGVSRFSPQFYGRNKDVLPFTDSDGLYDFPSSDKVNDASDTHQHRKLTGRKREKKMLRNCKTPSPTKTQAPNLLHYHLDVPGKEPFYKIISPRKPSPKRRARTTQIVSTSSSSDSINSAKDIRISSSSPSPDTIRWSLPVEWPASKGPKSAEASGEETGDDAKCAMLTKPDLLPKQQQKISRLRAISHQIRFLRRLELSLKRRERVISPSDSLESGDDSPRATSPLLYPSKSSKKIEIRKSNSIGKLQNTTGQGNSSRSKRGKYRRGELLVSHDEIGWKRAIITGNGHSD